MKIRIFCKRCGYPVNGSPMWTQDSTIPDWQLDLSEMYCGMCQHFDDAPEEFEVYVCQR